MSFGSRPLLNIVRQLYGFVVFAYALISSSSVNTSFLRYNSESVGSKINDWEG